MHLSMGGHLVTKVLEVLLDQRGGEYRSESIPKGCKQDMKEKMAYVALDFDAEMLGYQETTDTSYELPGGSEIRLGNERFRCAEVLFQPSHLDGLDGLGYGNYSANYGLDNFPKGVASMVYESINKSDRDIHKDLYCNVLLAGGGTMLRGMTERMEKELEFLARSPPDCRYSVYSERVKVIAPPDRKYSAWIGGACLSSLTHFQQSWVTKQEYKESGPSIVHRKCFS
jgi:actin